MTRALVVILIVLGIVVVTSAAEPRTPTHRVRIVSAEAAPTKFTGKPWDILGSSPNLVVRVSRRDSELEGQWTLLNAQHAQRSTRLALQGMDPAQDRLAKAIAEKRRAVADKFIGQTPPKSAIRHTWNFETIDVATGDVLLLQALDLDSSDDAANDYDIIGTAQWRVTADALNAGKPVTFTFDRVVQLTLEFRALGAAAAAKDTPPSRAEAELQRRLRRRAQGRIRGPATDAYVLALVETSWRPRELDLGDLGRGAAFVFDLLALPALATEFFVTGHDRSLSSTLPPAPPNTLQVDDIRFEVISGRHAAVRRTADFAGELVGLPAFPDGMPRVRRWAVVSHHNAVADAERKASKLRVRLEALRRRR